MLDQTELFNIDKPRFPWRLAGKMTVETAIGTLGLWFIVGASALLLEYFYETFGLGANLGLLAFIGFILAVRENRRALWAIAIPAMGRRLAVRRVRLGL